MTHITFQDGRVVMRDGRVGTEQECCCGGCEDCTLTCCLTIEGRNTCESGTDFVSDVPLIVVNWASTLQENGATIGAYQYLSDDFDLLVEFVWLCENGVLSLDIEVSEWIPGNAGVGDPAASYRRWANARAILNEAGCPTGVELGELTESEGPDPSITPTLGWD